MSQRRSLLSLSNPELILQLNLDSYSSDDSEHSASHDGSAAKDDKFVFNIDPNMLMGTSKLIMEEFVGEMWSHSNVYKDSRIETIYKFCF